MNKIISILFLFFLSNCSFLHYAENPSKEKELYIENFNEKIIQFFSANILDYDKDGKIKRSIKNHKNLKEKVRPVDLLQIEYEDLIAKYKYYLKYDKNNMQKSFEMFDSMQNFIFDSDIVKLLYEGQGHGFVYNTLTGKDLGFIGVIGTIDNDKQYKAYAVKNIKLVEEYENVRIPISLEIEKYANDIFDKWEKKNHEELLKRTKTNGYCGDIYSNQYVELSTYLNLNLNPNKDCIYRVGELKVLQVLEGGILVAGYDRGYGTTSNSIAFIYTNKKHVDNQIISSGHVYYSGRYSYISLLGKRTVNAFKAIDKNHYPFLWK